jgi:phosphate transport system substrate-binding protein
MTLAVTFTRFERRGLLICGLALAVAGCDADPAPQLRIVGSSTVYPFTVAVAEQFKRRDPQAPAPIVEATGTGGGIKLFCAGIGGNHPDMVNASRRITTGELAACRRNKVGDIVELQIGLDGLVLAQSLAGRPMALSRRDVYLALAADPFGKGPNRARTWRDVNPALPAVRIEVVGPPPTSGTRDSFNELFMEAGCRSQPEMQALLARDPARFKLVCRLIRTDGAFVEGGEDDNLIVQRIASNPDAIGVFGFSFLDQNRDRIRGLALEGVEATQADISAGRYHASRPLFLYARAAQGASAKFLREFSREAVWGPGGMLATRGLVPSDTATRAAQAGIAAALTPLEVL